MDVYEAIATRRTVRDFEDKPVERHHNGSAAARRIAAPTEGRSSWNGLFSLRGISS